MNVFATTVVISERKIEVDDVHNIAGAGGLAYSDNIAGLPLTECQDHGQRHLWQPEWEIGQP